MDSRSVIECLADGEFHSGEALGELWGVSRTAVWKHLQKLDALGVEVESVRGKGYRLSSPMELLDKVRIAGELTDAARRLLGELEVHHSVESTNRLALQRAERGAGRGYVCLAEHQSAGRGRHGRTWVSPFGQSLYLSVVADFDGGAAALEGLSLAVGVALVEALQELGVQGLRLKWPNDVLHEDAKLAGILLEMTGDPAGICSVVVGVGLNIGMPASAAQKIDQPWARLADLAPGVSRNRLTAVVLNRLLPTLEHYQQQGFAAYHQRWEAAHAHCGQPVVISTAQQRFHGIALGVSGSGALRVDLGDRIEEFYGGEVSLRALEDGGQGQE